MNLFSWGANSYGQLSHGSQSEQCLHPAEAQSASPFQDIVSLAAGGGHTLLLDSAGSVLAAGSNSHGQIGDCQNNTTILSPITALQEFKLKQIECGWDSSYGITDEGQVVVLGSNKYGQLGISKEKVTTTKHPIILHTPPIVQISAGLRHTAMLSSEGQVFMCGQGSKGQLGIVDSEGKVPRKDVDVLVKVEGLEDVRQVACGQHHTLAITSSGTVYGWGDNRRGQLQHSGPCSATPQILMSVDSDAVIRAGWTHSAVLSGGRVRTWGRNNYSQLGHSWSQDVVSQGEQLSGLEGVIQLELGSEHNLALLENGEVWSWGWNEHGNCGTGTVENVSVPQRVCVPPTTRIAAGAGHSLALCLL